MRHPEDVGLDRCVADHELDGDLGVGQATDELQRPRASMPSIAWRGHRADYELSGALLVLDTAWPLSMVGLVAIAGAAVARRRWPAQTRWLMLATSLWLPVSSRPTQ